jgi:hypothetical protein
MDRVLYASEQRTNSTLVQSECIVWDGCNGVRLCPSEERRNDERGYAMRWSTYPIEPDWYSWRAV